MIYIGNGKYDTMDGLVLTKEQIQEIIDEVEEKYLEDFTFRTDELKSEVDLEVDEKLLILKDNIKKILNENGIEEDVKEDIEVVINETKEILEEKVEFIFS